MRRPVLWLSICLGLSVSPAALAKEYGSGAACTGTIEEPNPTLAPLTELDSLGDSVDNFIGTAGRGGLCKARVYTVVPPGKTKLKVHRVWNTRTGKKWSGWWSFREPSGTEVDYRKAHTMCPSTGPADKFDRMVVCWLKPGAEFAVGPSQSKACTTPTGNVTVPQSATNQVYVALGSATYSMWVESCTEYPSPLK
jgi:hypothetical protein